MGWICPMTGGGAAITGGWTMAIGGGVQGGFTGSAGTTGTTGVGTIGTTGAGTTAAGATATGTAGWLR